ncbi:unnamed protein product [Amoebophrya sp. A120]|nr:unnamed protein product [Amoebophrya sp. A120]|eukprot:GSA120T00023149001.1
MLFLDEAELKALCKKFPKYDSWSKSPSVFTPLVQRVMRYFAFQQTQNLRQTSLSEGAPAPVEERENNRECTSSLARPVLQIQAKINLPPSRPKNSASSSKDAAGDTLSTSHQSVLEAAGAKRLEKLLGKVKRRLQGALRTFGQKVVQEFYKKQIYINSDQGGGATAVVGENRGPTLLSLNFQHFVKRKNGTSGKRTTGRDNADVPAAKKKKRPFGEPENINGGGTGSEVEKLKQQRTPAPPVSGAAVMEVEKKDECTATQGKVG